MSAVKTYVCWPNTRLLWHTRCKGCSVWQLWRDTYIVCWEVEHKVDGETVWPTGLVQQHLIIWRSHVCGMWYAEYWPTERTNAKRLHTQLQCHRRSQAMFFVLSMHAVLVWGHYVLGSEVPWRKLPAMRLRHCYPLCFSRGHDHRRIVSIKTLSMVCPLARGNT